MKHFVLIGLCLLTTRIFSQNEVDAIRYSQENLGSTARSFAVAGAFGAVGADPSCAAINPAGLARFRTSKFYFSNAFYNTKNKTTFLGNELMANKFNFNLPNIGFIINIPGEDYEEKRPQGFVNFVLAFNVNRLNNFHRRTMLDGINNNSITQNWAERANLDGVIPQQMSPFSQQLLAYNAYVIDEDTLSAIPKYKSAYGNGPINVSQSAANLSKGAMNDYNVSLAANYRHLIQGGISLGVKSVRYIETASFVEEDLKKSDTIKDIKSVTFDQYLRTKGTGFNAKLGFIVSPGEYFRFGYSFHSPTVYNLKDTYQYTIDAKFDYGAKDFYGDLRKDNVQTTNSTIYKYKITTPARHVMSLALVNKDVGFLSIDVEYVNYAGASLFAKDYKFIPENKNLSRDYNDVVNIRMGAELVQDMFRFRAGYGRYPSPYKANIAPDLRSLVSNVYTFGFGIKTDTYSFDIACVNSGYSDYYVPYSLSTGFSKATNNLRTTNVVMTVGLNLD